MAFSSYTLKGDFQYTHKNPYNEKLGQYSRFVLRDREPEAFQGCWCRGVFQRDCSLVVEVGSGYGHFMLEYCAQNPQVNFVGLDYRFKRGFQLVKRIHREGLCNIRYLRARGERLHFLFAPGEVDRVFFFFPDPWPKSRHRGRRLAQGAFFDSVHRILRPGGEFFIKTDHYDYFLWMDDCMRGDGRWEVELKTLDLYSEYSDHFLSAYKTKFEKIFLSQNIPIKAFVLRKR